MGNTPKQKRKPASPKRKRKSSQGEEAGSEGSPSTGTSLTGGVEESSDSEMSRLQDDRSEIRPELGGANDPIESAIDEEADSGNEERVEFLAFGLSDEEYAIELLSIKEIIRPVTITPVPRSPSYIKGIISLRGLVVPIYDLRIRLGLDESPEDRMTRILIAKIEKGVVGLIADRVSDVVRIAESDIEPPPGGTAGSTPGHLRGLGHVENRLLILLNLEEAIIIE